MKFLISLGGVLLGIGFAAVSYRPLIKFFIAQSTKPAFEGVAEVARLTQCTFWSLFFGFLGLYFILVAGKMKISARTTLALSTSCNVAFAFLGAIAIQVFFKGLSFLFAGYVLAVFLAAALFLRRSNRPPLRD